MLSAISSEWFTFRSLIWFHTSHQPWASWSNGVKLINDGRATPDYLGFTTTWNSPSYSSMQCRNLLNTFRNGSSIDKLDTLGGTISLPEQLLADDSFCTHGWTSAWNKFDGQQLTSKKLIFVIGRVTPLLPLLFKTRMNWNIIMPDDHFSQYRKETIRAEEIWKTVIDNSFVASLVGTPTRPDGFLCRSSGCPTIHFFNGD